MSRKLLAILAALLVAVSLCACNNEEEKNTEGDTIDMPSETGTGEKESTNETETDEHGNEVGTGAAAEIGDPGEYNYTECSETVYVNNPNSAVTLRSATYEAKDSVAHGTELKRIGLSMDKANYWSKVVYEGNEYYVASRYLTTVKDADEGFVEVTKTVVINDKTGSMNVRNVPSMESTVIGHVSAGVKIKVIAENTVTGWYKIEFVNNENVASIGYIASDAKYFVQPETEASTSVTTEKTTETTGETTSETATETTTEASTGK